MIKRNILIFPSGTEIAFEINNALKYSKFVNIYAGSSVEDHSEMVYTNLIKNIPFIGDDLFIDEMNKVINEYNIDFIYPAHDSVIMYLAEHEDKIEAKIVSTEFKTVSICRSKQKTYDFLNGETFIPKTFSLSSVEDYPVFIKPKVGQGAIGARIINSKEELDIYYNDDMVICEYLKGDEITVDCFTDKDGKLLVVSPRSRERIRTGIAVRSTTVKCDDNIRNIAKILNDKFTFNGAWFFQMKKNNIGEYKLLEISPRIPGTMGLSRNLGINFPLLTIMNMLDMDLNIIHNDNAMTLDRAFISRYKQDISYNTVYVDYDDTLIIKDKVNLQLISFLYQCVNNNKNIILLTRHSTDILDALTEKRIDRNLFTKIIHIKDKTPKSNYIKDNDSIFIDDSFAERKDVKESKHISVFDVDMIESLLDWRL